MNFRDLIKRFAKGEDRVALESWLRSTVGEEVYKEADKQRRMALKRLQIEACTSSDPTIAALATKHRELSELVVFLSGAEIDDESNDKREADGGTNRGA